MSFLSEVEYAFNSDRCDCTLHYDKFLVTDDDLIPVTR